MLTGFLKQTEAAGSGAAVCSEPSLDKMLTVALKSPRHDIIYLDRIMRHMPSWTSWYRFRLEEVEGGPSRIVACLDGNIWTRDQGEVRRLFRASVLKEMRVKLRERRLELENRDCEGGEDEEDASSADLTTEQRLGEYCALLAPSFSVLSSRQPRDGHSDQALGKNHNPQIVRRSYTLRLHAVSHEHTQHSATRLGGVISRGGLSKEADIACWFHRDHSPNLSSMTFMAVSMTLYWPNPLLFRG